MSYWCRITGNLPAKSTLLFNLSYWCCITGNLPAKKHFFEMVSKVYVLHEAVLQKSKKNITPERHKVTKYGK